MNNTNQKILVVDDEPDLQMLMLQKFRDKVKNKEFEFLFAEDGEEALHSLEQNQDVSLVLADINMPKMDGLTMLSELQKLNRYDLKTVMVSAYGDMGNIRTAMNRGAYDFVTKPIDFKDLEATIEKTLREIWRIHESREMEAQLKALNVDLDMAARIQQKLLQQDFPVFPDDSRFDIFANMMAAKHVGGDFFDFFMYDDHHLAFFIGDVAGKGMPAAIYMAVCCTMLKAIGSEVFDPGKCLEKVNQMLIPESEESTFVTVFYGVLNISDGTFHYSNGGHEQPFLLTGNGEAYQLEDVGGLLLGKFEMAEYDTKTLKLSPGSSITTFTDGITEAVAENDDFFESSRLMEYLQKTHSKKIDARIKGLFIEVMKFAGAAEQSDDITALAVEYHGGQCDA